MAWVTLSSSHAATATASFLRSENPPSLPLRSTAPRQMIEIDVAAAEDDADATEVVAGAEGLGEGRREGDGGAGLDHQLGAFPGEAHRGDNLVFADRDHVVEQVADHRPG